MLQKCRRQYLMTASYRICLLCVFFSLFKYICKCPWLYFFKFFFSGARISIVNARKKIHFSCIVLHRKNVNHSLWQNGLNSSFRDIESLLLLFASHCTRPIHILSFWGQFSRNCHTYKFICMICTMPVYLSLNQKSFRVPTNTYSLYRVFGENRILLKSTQKSNGSFTSKQT